MAPRLPSETGVPAACACSHAQAAASCTADPDGLAAALGRGVSTQAPGVPGAGWGLHSPAPPWRWGWNMAAGRAEHGPFSAACPARPGQGCCSSLWVTGEREAISPPETRLEKGDITRMHARLGTSSLQPCDGARQCVGIWCEKNLLSLK